MRIYIENFNFKNIDINKLEKYITSKNNIIEIYSSDGIFIIKNNNFCKQITICDGDILSLNNYIDNYNIVVDKSLIYKSKYHISQIPNDHYSKNIILYEFKENESSPVSFMLEIHNNSIDNSYFMLTDKHAAYSEADIINPFTKESIQFFLKKIS